MMSRPAVTWQESSPSVCAFLKAISLAFRSLISNKSKLHCVLIETFSQSLYRADWFKLISYWRGHYCIVIRLNHCPPPRQDWYKKSYTCLVFSLSISNWEIFSFICPYLSLVNCAVFSLSFYPFWYTTLNQRKLRNLLLTILKYAPFYVMLCKTHPKFFERKLLT